MSWRENRNFKACPPGVVQWRHIQTDHPYDGKPGLRTLWRTEHCNPDRWHYVENPCNCYHSGRPTMWGIVQHHGYRLQPATLERGTWRRDGRGIAAVLVAERKRIRDQREADAIGRAARGPQRRSSKRAD